MREDVPWAVVKAIFHAAVEQPAEERAAFLDEVCGSDTIRGEVERLLASDEQTESFIDEPAWRATPAPSAAAVAAAVATDPTTPAGDHQVGPYHIKRVIGSGGMGTVYEAMQARPRRVVALKVMKRGLASRSALRRFEYEAQILARLRHPGIAHVYDAGFHDDGSGGVPYFAMEYVPNARPITVFVQRMKLDVRERLALFCRVCEAVHHGHQKGIVHRDLKPDNILVDTSGQPKVIDFGVARATDADLAVTTLQTDVGQLVGTVQYMSPEQVDADPHDIDVRSDVYTLGVVLYEMLCEEMPYDIRGRSILEASRVVVESAPARPRTVNGALSGDLETIMLKALEKNRDRRYQSAVELARDVRRFLDDRPIEARPPSMARQMHLYARRHRAVFAAASAIAIGLVVATAVSIVFLLQARASARDARWAAYKATLVAVQSALEHEEEAVARERLESIPGALRGWEWSLLQAQTISVTVTERDEAITEVLEGIGPSGPFRLVGRRDGMIAQLAGLPPRPLRNLTGHEHEVWSLAVNAGGDVAASGDEGGAVRVWDLVTGRERARYDAHDGPVIAVALDASGTRVASGGQDGTVRIGVVASADVPRVITTLDGWVRSVDFSPDGRELAAAGRDKTLRILDVDTGAVRDTLETKFWFNAVRYLPDGRLVVATMSKAMLWTPGAGTPEALVNRDIVLLGFSRDGRRVIMGGSDRRVRIYDLEERRVVAEWRLPKADVRGVGFGADGVTAFAIDSLGIVRWWDASGERPYVQFQGHAGRVPSIAFSPCGTRIATGGEDTTVRLWDAATGRLLATLEGHETWVTDLVFTPDGSRLVSVSGDKTGRIWNSWTGALVGTMTGHEAWIACAAMAPDGAVVATGAWDATIRLWSVATGSPLATLTGHEDSVWSLQYTGADTLVSSAWDRTVRTWSAAERAETGRVELAQGGIFVVRDSRDGTRRATIGDTLELVISDPRTGAVIARRDGPEVVPAELCVFDDEDRLISAWVDGGVRIHHLRTGEDLLVLRHDTKVSSMDLAADGRIAVGHYDGRARLWDAVPWPERQAERREIVAAEARMAAYVDGLLRADGAEADTVAARLRNDVDLSGVERRAALNVLLDEVAGPERVRPGVLARPEEAPAKP